MKKFLNKIKRIFKYIGAIFYLLYYRIKNIKKEKGIAQVVESLNSGGLEQVAVNIYKTFKNNNTNSNIIVLSNNLGPMCQQLESPKDLRIVYYDIVSFIKFCAKNNIRTLVFHFTTYHMILLKLLGFRNYYIIHNTYIWYKEKEWKTLKTKLKFTNGIIAVSEWCKEYFSKKTGINNIKVILNGIDFANLNKGEICSFTKDKLKIKENDICCLTIGSYTDGKHQMEIIGIAEKIIKKIKNIKFICAGPILNKDLYDEFMKNIKKSSAKNNIIALNYIPQEEMGDFINKMCDIYLQPSIHEAGVPLTVMEALLKGKPVIMSDFMIEKTFPNCSRIVGVKLPYKDITKVTPEKASKMSKKTVDDSTEEYVDKILEMIDNLDNMKNNFDVNDYEFLSVKRMGKEYLEYIKI